MSFYTGLSYYRPCDPPPLKGTDLARFLGRFRDSGLLTDVGTYGLSLKFGDAIDQDELGTTWEEEIAPRMSTVHEIEWDLELMDCDGVQASIDVLSNDERRVYRAFISLGNLPDEVVAPITRTGSPENESDFCPCELSISVGPVEIYSLVTEEIPVVGWIGVEISGYGYLYPWTFREVVERLESSAGICQLMEICQSTWPVPSSLPDRRMAAMRKQLEDLWPYDTLDKPWDWYWGLQETG